MATGDRPRPWSGEDAHADILRRRGDAHERAQLARLIDEAGGDWADLGDTAPWDDPVAAARRTERAMRDGRRLIFQASFLGGRWQGRADFLRRVETPSALGPFSYEVLDTKLARHVSPGHVHQLCLYSRLLGALQGVEPDRAHVVLGDGRAEAVELRRYRALHRHACRRLERLVDAPLAASYPEPTGHCPICRFERECLKRRRADDHLSLVAGARRDQRQKLVAARLTTLAELAVAPEDHPVPRLAPERVATLHHQARLQLNVRREVEPSRRHLAAEHDRGYARLPAPSPGDVFFDLEGDPYAAPDGGIEYLWGWATAGGYACLWAHDERQERHALETFVAAVDARRRAHPDLHVFHYGAVEATTLRRLALRYATCEAAIDDWLREGVLVDLYAVVRQALQVGEESYSLKRLERHHGFVRHETSIREGGGSIVAYERWLETRDDALLAAIRRYNEEDCRSTESLYRWLRERMRPEAERELAVDFSALAASAKPYTPPKWLPEVTALADRLHLGLPGDPELDDPRQHSRRLLGHLLLYHYRESKPEWWSFFALKEMSSEELVEERDAVGLIALDASVSPEPVSTQSYGWTYRFPAQETRLVPGPVTDPLGGGHTLVSIGETTLVLSRRKKDPPPTPRALIRSGPVDAAPLRKALISIARPVAEGEPMPRAIGALLRHERPRTDGAKLGSGLDDLIRASLALDGSYLAVQGPPGTGKTYNGARMIVAALHDGRRVALTAGSHHAIQNMLHAVEDAARRQGRSFRGVYKGGNGAPPYVSSAGMVEEVGSNEDADSDDFALVAGTSWLLARDEHVGRFDELVVDEAGQMSLASAVAAGRCASNIVLLGDPQQLPQVNQASHPGGSGASVLGHLLDGHDVIPPDRGVLLDVSWRMHPDICAFVSERSYAGALRSRPECARRRIDAPGRLTGAGLRVFEVAHEGRGQDSPEEAAAIAAACGELLSAGATVTDDTGEMRLLVPDDVMVVAPYNLAASCIRAHVPAGVRVGTVDKFQGQEAPVVFFAMTSSSGEDVPRGLDFVFDRNRLNVAISRAQCLAVLVHCPRLLAAEARTLAQMELIDGACRFVEQDPSPVILP